MKHSSTRTAAVSLVSMSTKRHIVSTLFFVVTLTLLGVFVFAYGTAHVFAESEVAKLRREINDRNARLSEIESEIAAYRAELQEVGSEKKTLQSAINQLELERKKVQADISYTESKIGTTDLEISKLDIEIRNAEDSIAEAEAAIKELIRRLHETDDTTLVETLLTHENLAEFWNSVEEIQSVKTVMGERVDSLVSQKILLEGKHTENLTKRNDLLALKNQYSDQNAVLSNNKAEKSELLEVTKSEEAEYQRLLREREAARELIIKELRDFESQLQFILDPNTIPAPGTPVFIWPLENVVITQLFGGTEFARQNASVYAGRAYHPGIDLGAPRGTQIRAPLAGTVRATGNTDAFPGCYSWGKWTLIDHANGLSTLYAHQDVISVSPGQSVATGQVIGYTGNTGYSTGPHLHFTVYAKAGVSVRRFNEIKTVTSCGAATTPVAATDAYIDPMLYLPPR